MTFEDAHGFSPVGMAYHIQNARVLIAHAHFELVDDVLVFDGDMWDYDVSISAGLIEKQSQHVADAEVFYQIVGRYTDWQPLMDALL